MNSKTEKKKETIENVNTKWTFDDIKEFLLIFCLTIGHLLPLFFLLW